MGIRDWLWRHGEQGRAWQAYENGATRYATTLDVSDGNYQQTISAIEDAGWILGGREDHGPVRKTTVNPQSDGGHEVIKTVEMKATFSFRRAAVVRIASAIEDDRSQRAARKPRPRRARSYEGGDAEVDRSAELRRKAHVYLRAKPHRYRALAATLSVALGFVLLSVFFLYRHKTLESDSGHLWWKEHHTRIVDVTASDKLPVLLISVVFLGLGAILGWSAFRYWSLQDGNVAAVAGAKDSRRKRDAARAIAARDPEMARQLRIGRPDLRREYDDGGLVDVNSMPAESLVAWLGIDRADADGIVTKRADFGGFEHESEIETLVGLDPRKFAQIRDRIVLL